MIEWFINDLSLAGQFHEPNEFKEALMPLFLLRLRNSGLKNCLYCSRLLINSKVTNNLNFQQAVIATRDRSFVSQVLHWLSKSGPFWDDSRQNSDNDYFEYLTYDVTNQGLGEAARRKLIDIEANVFSFLGGQIPFNTTPLLVRQGLREQPITDIAVENQWQISQVKDLLSHIQYSCWQDVHTRAVEMFGNLIISNYSQAMETLSITPFNKRIAERIIFLLNILNELSSEIDECSNQPSSNKRVEILKKYFAGSCGNIMPLFKPESDTNKRNFRNELTFQDPENPSNRIFCEWHGVIKSPQTRIHFEWPPKTGQKKIKVVYIGPKITKK